MGVRACIMQMRAQCHLAVSVVLCSLLGWVYCVPCLALSAVCVCVCRRVCVCVWHRFGLISFCHAAAVPEGAAWRTTPLLSMRFAVRAPQCSPATSRRRRRRQIHMRESVCTRARAGPVGTGTDHAARPIVHNYSNAGTRAHAKCITIEMLCHEGRGCASLPYVLTRIARSSIFTARRRMRRAHA